jgi:hypothetical protein
MLSAVTTNDNVAASLSTLAMQSAIIASIAGLNVAGNLVDTLVKK